jgi:hypothetical protein
VKGNMTFPQTVWIISTEGYPSPDVVEIVGETSRSWISGPTYCRQKHPKNKTVFIAAHEAKKRLWCIEHAYSIGRRVETFRFNTDILTKIAELIGYEPNFAADRESTTSAPTDAASPTAAA